ncbi:MAG: hypothetical protein K2I06_04515 [Ruminococcus sp.]|nr:hypothetical protein [Ruminococcus sp.]
MQKNCVAGYAEKINFNRCMIYSAVYEKYRHTIEIIQVNGSYKVVQCYRACNQVPDRQLLDNLTETVNKINHIL